MSFDRCIKTWASSGKDHYCVLPLDHAFACRCDCGEKMPSAQRPPLKLAHWKRGRKKVEGTR